MLCRLTAFPAAACGLKLALLDLTYNDLTALPPQLGLMTSLRALPLSGNPLRCCPQSTSWRSVLACIQRMMAINSRGVVRLGKPCGERARCFP